MISDFIKKFGLGVKDYTTQVTLGDLGTGVKQTAGGIVGGLKGFGQQSMRAYAAIGGRITGQPLRPSTYFQQELYGTAKAITPESFAGELGIPQKSKFAVPVGLALGAVDLIPGGQVSKRGAVSLLKNANKAEDALRILTKTMGVAKDVATKYLDDAVRLTDEKQLFSLVEKVVNESQEVSRFLKKGKQVVSGLFKAPEIQPLAQEARKYKSAEEFVKAQTKSNSWSEAQKTNPDLWDKGILRKDIEPYGAKGVIPKEVHSAQGKWQNYGEFDEISADKVYKRIDSGSFKGEYEDKFGNPVRDNNGNVLQDVYDDTTGEWIQPMVSNKELRNELLDSFTTKEGKQYLNEVINALPKNPDGTITAYRIGKIGGGEVQSYTLSEGMAKTFSNQGTGVLPAGTPGLPTKGYKDFGTLPTNMVKIDPKGIKAWSPYDAEILVEPKFVQTKSQLTDIWKGAKGIPPKIISKERGFIESAKEVVPEADKIAGQYIPRSTDELSIKAKNLIASDFATAERIALTESDDKAVAIASELLKKYADDAAKATDPAQVAALYDKAADIANTLAPKLTEQGRSIQAASILGRLTPEGQVRFAAKEIQRYNELNPTKRIAELTGEQTKFINEEMKEINNMKDGVERAMRFQKVQNYISDLVPTPVMKKVIAVWKAGLLTGMKTQGLNIFANISHGVTEIAKDIPATIVDSAAALFTGKRTKAFTTKGVVGGLQEGWDKGIRYLTTGFDERNIGAKLDYKRVNFGKGAVAKAFQTYTDTVFRFLGAQDQPFYYGALSRSLMDQALAQGKNAGKKGKELVEFAEKLVQAPTEEMIRYGVADATTAVFQNQTKLGEAAKKIQQLPGVGEFVLPFGRTPSAVAMQIINYSPVGIAKTIIANIGKGKFDQRLFSQGIGRGITGTGALAIGVALAKKGLIALDYPQGDEREQELQKAEGVKNNAIKIGDKWRSPIILGPAGNLLLIGGHLQVALETSGSATEALTKAMLGGLKSFTEQTFLTGIQNAVNALTDPETYAKSYLPNLVASFVPTLASDVAKATDPKERRAETTIQKIQTRIPLARQGLEPQVDILGRERESIGNPLEILIDPSRPSPDVSTPVTEELRRLTEAGFKVSPTALGDRQGFDALSQNENTKMWKLTGGIVNDKLTSLFSKEEYLQLSDDEKAKVVGKVIDQSKINARAGVVIALTRGLEGEELQKKLSELKSGGLITREVFNKYLELR